MTYNEKIKQQNSEKAILVWLEPSQRLLFWTLDSGAIYKRSVDYYIVNVKKEDSILVESDNAALDPGEWFYDFENNDLYVRLLDDSNPTQSFMSVNYRLFFSSMPTKATHNMEDDGNVVNYDARLINEAPTSYEIDNEDQFGIALESGGLVTFVNSDGFFEPVFDKLFFEEQNISIFSWFPYEDFSEKNRMFNGQIKDKSYSDQSISFSLKTFVFNLRQKISLNKYSLLDGKIPDSVIGKPKRLIYGKVDGAKTQSVDQVLDGIPLAGTLSGDSESDIINGVGTDFYNDLSPGDELLLPGIDGTSPSTVDEIISSIQLKVSQDIDVGFGGVEVSVKPIIPLRTRNRKHIISGHKLRAPTSTIIRLVKQNILELVSIEDFEENDFIFIGIYERQIKRISQSGFLVITQNLPISVNFVGQTVTKIPVSAVFFKSRRLFVNRDWTVTNNSSECYITFNSLAEFNVAPVKSISGTVTITNGSRLVTGVDTKFTDLKPRDWIKSGDINHAIWYEVLEIKNDTEMSLRILYAATTFIGSGKQKQVDYIGDSSLVSCNVTGKENDSGKWIKTASDAIQDVLEISGVTLPINSASFVEAKEEMPYTLSLMIPLGHNEEPPLAREIVELVNKSVFGSLVSRADFTIAYNVLSPHRQDLEVIERDDRVLDWEVETRTEIFRSVTGNFAHFDIDRYNQEEGSKTYTHDNSFVNYLIGAKETESVEIYLYEKRFVENIVERYALHHSLTQSVIKIEAKMEFIKKNINDKVLIAFDRMYQRFGEVSNKRKIGIISKIERYGTGTNIEISDLGNTFSRVGGISPDDAVEFTSSSEVDRMSNGYIVDDDLEVPDITSEAEIGSNIIG